MRSTIIAISVFILMSVASAVAADEPSIIPLPQHMERLAGSFRLTPKTRIYTDRASAETGEILAGYLRKSTGWRFKISGKTTPDLEGAITNGILLTTNDADASLGDEGYELKVVADRAIIRAPTQAGLFYGVQTLLQLLPSDVLSGKVVAGVDWQMPCVEIKDWPRFKWRGLMLDVSRHFFTKLEVEQLLNAMALHKLNVFHWHLTDDNGWRIQIKKYPKLTSMAAWRKGVDFGLATNSTTAYDRHGRYGGFYTQKDIREVVAYAGRLHITVVPEIEMPGHSLAALVAYPQYGTGNGPFAYPLEGDVGPGIYDPANEQTFEFLDNVLAEVFRLFPGEYIHIGGDEVPPQPWRRDPECVELMRREGLKTPAELETWFLRRMEKFTEAQGKTMVGWSEIARGGLPPNAVLMDWIGGGKEAASAGHDVVMTPSPFCYYSQYQSTNHATEPKGVGFVPLERVYSFEPIPADLAPEFQKHILGAEGCVWTEWICNPKHLEYMIFPRESALAEVTWSAKDGRNLDDFKQRLKVDQQRLNALGVNYRP
jgi:hexosaminidase